MHTRTNTVPLGGPAVIGVAGLAAVVAASGARWQLVVSALLALLLIGVDARRVWTARRA